MTAAQGWLAWDFLDCGGYIYLNLKLLLANTLHLWGGGSLKWHSAVSIGAHTYWKYLHTNCAAK